MKPNPEPILKAAESLEAEPEDCVLIGDSLSDIEGAKAVGIPVIGYANKASKLESFSRAGANAVVTEMAAIAAAVRASYRNV
jgi:beta-phosphoglucomutase-like phosphatase (HAD superfamily)